MEDSLLNDHNLEIDELVNQRQKVIVWLLKQISLEAKNVEKEHVEQKWCRMLDGSKRLSPEKAAINMSAQLQKNTYQFDQIVSDLKLKEYELDSVVAQKLQELEKM